MNVSLLLTAVQNKLTTRKNPNVVESQNLLLETPEDLQNQLNSFLLYCKKWKLEILLKKNISYFLKRNGQKITFYYNNIENEIVKHFIYLEVILLPSEYFIQTKNMQLKELQTCMVF